LSFSNGIENDEILSFFFNFFIIAITMQDKKKKKKVAFGKLLGLTEQLMNSQKNKNL
jgi:hypothetical protein